MKPLLFLTYRGLVNGFKRALGSPQRLIGLLFFLGYYLLVFVRPAFSPRGRFEAPQNMRGSIEVPSLQVIDAVVFGLMAAVSIFLLISMASHRNAFKQSDVDVLFPTPVSPKVVLMFRIARDYLFTLILPFVILLFGFRPAQLGWESIFRNLPNPEYSGMTLRLLSLSWILIAMAWVAMTYAVSLMINRSDLKSDRNMRILSWGIVAAILAVGVYLYFQTREAMDVKRFIEILEAPVLRVFFFTASFASMMVMAPLTGNWLMGFIGAGSLIGLVAVSIKVALAQSGWMYDQAAVKGFDGATLKDLQRKGDMIGMASEMARRGKIKSGRQIWIHRWKATGIKALLWKEYFLQTRGMLAFIAFLGLLTIFMALIPGLVPERRSNDFVPFLFYFMQGMALLSTTLSMAQVGFIEVLRRVDLLKPLPFSPFQLSLYEVAGRSVFGVVASTCGAIGFVITKPEHAIHSLTAIILAPGVSLLMSSAVWLVTVLFPDVDDQTQRQFRGLVTLIALAVMGAAPAGAFFGLWTGLNIPSIIAGLLASGLSVGIAMLASLIAGNLYQSYNPSE